MKRYTTFLLLFISFHTSLIAQKDTVFWFVAPEITKGQIGYDNPTVFRFSTYDTDAVVTVSLPANPSFSPQQFNISAGSTAVLDMGAWVETIENKPANQVLNKGILIRSTQPITAYYEVIGQTGTNPELFSLKGKNALGTRFFTPFQTFLDNSNNPGHTPFPHAAFDIVATENNTSVTITPSKAIVGHAAGVPFTITLNQGQTFSCEAASQNATDHPNGSLVTSNKPIAISVKDDLLDGSVVYGGFCRDLVGDQIVPVNYVGKRYAVQAGFLDGDERVVLVATEDGTTVEHNGGQVASLDAGESTTLLVNTSTNHFITGSKPIYVFHISGIGCEVAGEVMPSRDCSGWRSVRFVRSSGRTFVLFVVCKSGNEDAFRINGNPNLLPASSFAPLPGSGGEFVASKVSFPTGLVVPGASTLVENTEGGLFHLGFLDGEQAVGCLYGFFSDYLNKVVVQDSVAFCQGDTVQSHGLDIWEAGNYETVADGTFDCDTLYQIKATVSQYTVARTGDLPWCPGDSIVVNGQVYTAPGVYMDTILAVSGEACDTILTIDIVETPYIFTYDNYEICPGTSIEINGVFFDAPGIIFDTIFNIGIGCDTIHKILVDWAPVPEFNNTIEFCPGDTVWVGTLSFSQPFILTDTLEASVGCDTIYTTTGIWTGSTANLLPDSSIAFCTGTPVVFQSPYPETVWNGQIESSSYTVTSTGIVTVRFIDPNGCIGTDTVTIVPCCDIDKVYVPNVFSPQHPPNDRFNISVNPICIPLHMRVYDRWGSLVYQADQFETGWDGTLNGKKCAAGVYVWILEMVETGEKRTVYLKGDVTLIR